MYIVENKNPKGLDESLGEDSQWGLRKDASYVQMFEILESI